VRLPGESWKGDPGKGESERAPKGTERGERRRGIREREREREREAGKERR